MTKARVKQALATAIGQLLEEDRFLLTVDASERSITHRLALYLTNQFAGLDVDCEYNRDGFDVKRLALTGRSVQDDDEEAVTVFPDIVVHRRGQAKQNILVIELKKRKHLTRSEYDREKLKAFRRELGYRFAAQVIVGLSKAGHPTSSVSWLDENARPGTLSPP